MYHIFFSFLITHVLNFGLSLRRLLKITELTLPSHIPLLSAAAAIGAVWGSGHLSIPSLQIITYPALLFSAMYLLRILGREDLRWVRGLVRKKDLTFR